MADFKSFFSNTNDCALSAVIFTKDEFINVEKLLQWLSEQQQPFFQIKAIITKNNHLDQYAFFTEKYNTLLESVNFEEFNSATDDIRAKENWQNYLKIIKEKFSADFGVFLDLDSSYGSIDQLPCLCLHPGDLTCEENGERLFVGGNIESIEKMIVASYETIRSSIYLVDSENTQMKRSDLGFVLGVSDDMDVDLLGHPQEELEACFYARNGERSADGYADCLEKVAYHNLQILKEKFDFYLLKQVLDDFTKEKFLISKSPDTLYYQFPKSILKISTVMYGKEFKELIFSID